MLLLLLLLQTLFLSLSQIQALRVHFKKNSHSLCLLFRRKTQKSRDIVRMKVNDFSLSKIFVLYHRFRLVKVTNLLLFVT